MASVENPKGFLVAERAFREIPRVPEGPDRIARTAKALKVEVDPTGTTFVLDRLPEDTLIRRTPVSPESPPPPPPDPIGFLDVRKTDDGGRYGLRLKSNAVSVGRIVGMLPFRDSLAVHHLLAGVRVTGEVRGLTQSEFVKSLAGATGGRYEFANGRFRIALDPERARRLAMFRVPEGSWKWLFARELTDAQISSALETPTSLLTMKGQDMRNTFAALPRAFRRWIEDPHRGDQPGFRQGYIDRIDLRKPASFTIGGKSLEPTAVFGSHEKNTTVGWDLD